MLQDIVLSPCLPPQDYFKPHIPCSGDNYVALCTLCRAGSSQGCLCSWPQTWVCGNTGLQWKHCPRHHGRGDGAGGGLGPWRRSLPVMVKPVLSPHQPCLVFELCEAFGAGISHPCWAGGCVCLCLHMEWGEKCSRRKSLCVTELLCPLPTSQQAFYIPQEYPTGLECAPERLQRVYSAAGRGSFGCMGCTVLLHFSNMPLILVVNLNINVPLSLASQRCSLHFCE